MLKWNQEIVLKWMRNEKRKGALALCLGASTALALSACQSGGGTGSESSKQQDSGNCSSEYVSDYNTVVIRISGPRFSLSASELDQYKNLVTQFGSKYRGVVCVAALNDPTKLDAVPTSINTDQKVAEWLKAIEDARPQPARYTDNSDRYTPPPRVERSNECSSDFTDRFNDINTSFIKFKEMRDLERIETQIRIFSYRYKGTTCKGRLINAANGMTTEETIDADKWIKDWSDILALLRAPSQKPQAPSTQKAPATQPGSHSDDSSGNSDDGSNPDLSDEITQSLSDTLQAPSEESMPVVQEMGLSEIL